MYIILGIFLFLVSGIICHHVAKRRNANPVFWGVLGVVLGPIAIPFSFFSKNKDVRQPVERA